MYNYIHIVYIIGVLVGYILYMYIVLEELNEIINLVIKSEESPATLSTMV